MISIFKEIRPICPLFILHLKFEVTFTYNAIIFLDIRFCLVCIIRITVIFKKNSTILAENKKPDESDFLDISLKRIIICQAMHKQR